MSLTGSIVELFRVDSLRKFLWTIVLFTTLLIQTDSTLTIISQPLPQTDCYGNLVQFFVSVAASVGTVTYQWQRRPPEGIFTDIDGENNFSLSVYNIGMYGLNTDGTEYRVTVTDDYGTSVSNSAVLHINSITNITPAVVNSTICSGGSITYTVFSTGIPLNYQWECNGGSGWTVLSDNPVFAGTTTSQLIISNATTSQNGSYRISITFATLNQPATDPACIETSFTRIRNLVVMEPVLTSSIYHR